MLLDVPSNANLLLRGDSGGSLLALQGVWGLPSFPADCHPICSQHSDSFLPRSPSSFPECWPPDKRILAELVLAPVSSPSCRVHSRGWQRRGARRGRGRGFSRQKGLHPLPGAQSHPWEWLRLCQCAGCWDGASPCAVGDREAPSRLMPVDEPPAAAHGHCCPLPGGVSALGDTQTSPTSHKILFCYIRQMLGSSSSKGFMADLGTPGERGRDPRSGHGSGRTPHGVQLSHGITAVPEHAVLMTLFLFLRNRRGGKGAGFAKNLTISCMK